MELERGLIVYKYLERPLGGCYNRNGLCMLRGLCLEGFVMDVTVQSVQGMLARLSSEDLNTVSKFIQFLLERHSVMESSQTFGPSCSVEQSKEDAIAELRSLCHPGKHVWTEDPSDYVRRMRDEERI